MKIFHTAFILIFPILVHAQDSVGIKFKKFENWDAVVNQAKKEKKYIFIDCFATWCGPCKKMDVSVFKSEDVGKYFESNFISIKVQFDSTNFDDHNTIQWREIAKHLKDTHLVKSFPTYLFFSSDGEIVHRKSGFMEEKDFLLLASTATDSNKQIYPLLNKFKAGIFDTSNLVSLAYFAKSLNQKDVAIDISDSYLRLWKKAPKFTKEDIGFLTNFSMNTETEAFNLLLEYADSIDNFFKQPGYTEKSTDRTISIQYLYPYISIATVTKPKWGSIHRSIRKQFGNRIATRIVLQGKVYYYERRNDWEKYADNMVRLVSEFGGNMEMVMLNNAAWRIFLHSKNRSRLQSAELWMQRVVKEPEQYAEFIDTYANILYKLGKISKAIEWQKKAISLAPESVALKDVLTKMQKGEPTWVSK